MNAKILHNKKKRKHRAGKLKREKFFNHWTTQTNLFQLAAIVLGAFSCWYDDSFYRYCIFNLEIVSSLFVLIYCFSSLLWCLLVAINKSFYSFYVFVSLLQALKEIKSWEHFWKSFKFEISIVAVKQWRFAAIKNKSRILVFGSVHIYATLEGWAVVGLAASIFDVCSDQQILGNVYSGEGGWRRARKRRG